MAATLSAQREQNIAIGARRWLPRFRLRTLLIAVTAICLLLGGALAWYRSKEDEYRRQQQIGGMMARLQCVNNWSRLRPGWLEWTDDWRASEVLFCRMTIVVIKANTDAARVVELLPSAPTAGRICIVDEKLTDDLVRRLSGIASVKELFVQIDEATPSPEVMRRLDTLHQHLPGMEVKRW